MSKPIQDKAQSVVSDVTIEPLKAEEIESGVKIYVSGAATTNR